MTTRKSTKKKKTTRAKATKKKAKPKKRRTKPRATVSMRSPLGSKPVVKPEPVVEKPAPVVEQPAPVVEKPAPVVKIEPQVVVPVVSLPTAQPGWISVIYEGQDTFFHREAGVFVNGTRTSLRAELAEKLRNTRGFRLAG